MTPPRARGSTTLPREALVATHRDGTPGAGAESTSTTEAVSEETCVFEVYRADEIRMTAFQLGGGDWHWRLCDGNGQSLVDAGGYRTERACREAITLLKSHAARAAVTA